MRSIILAFLILIYSSGSAQATTVLVLGDSISAAFGLLEEEGWVHLAEKQLRETNTEIQFVNASISGDTTAGGLRRLPAALSRFEPDIVLIELGGNDGLRGYPIHAMQDNLESMVELIEAADAKALIAGMRIPSNYGAAYTEKFFDAFQLAAQNTGADLLPFILEPIATERSYFQRDGVHPTAEAQPLLAAHVIETLQNLLDTEPGK
ncbi:MAG: arylesterase [Gammaproteobacteria bacterium]|nr:arylesterase [Gammaproteobacteria bacterium]